jgi:ribosomal protein S27AE
LELLKVCPECGEKDYLLFVEDGSYFCGKCGKTVLPPDKKRAKLFNKP